MSDHKNNMQGIAATGLILAVLIVGAFVVGILISTTMNRDREGDLPSPNQPQADISPTQSPEVPGASTPTVITPSPTQSADRPQSQDQEIEQISDDLDQLGQELETLDQVETDLELPEVDFSTDEL